MNSWTDRQAGLLLMLLMMLPPAVAADEHTPVSVVTPGQPAVFSVHDRNQDGYLDQEEYQQLLRQRAAYRVPGGCGSQRKLPALAFADIDTDTSGYISEDEMVASLNKRLRKHRRYRYHGGR